jgi:Protein of unknown function (DUF2975)
MFLIKLFHLFTIKIYQISFNIYCLSINTSIFAPSNHTIMSKTNKFVFLVLHIIAWIIFVGLCIEAGALLVNFAFSIYNPEVISRLYQKLDLMDMYNQDPWVFYRIYSFILTVAILKAYLFYFVIILLLKLDMTKPFDSWVADKISKISYITFAIGIVSYIAKQTCKNLMHKNFDVSMLDQFWTDSQAFILMAAIIYVIATIFQKGVELQNENDLTV